MGDVDQSFVFWVSDCDSEAGVSCANKLLDIYTAFVCALLCCAQMCCALLCCALLCAAPTHKCGFGLFGSPETTRYGLHGK